MGVITIQFRDRILKLYESEIVQVTSRTITNIDKEMSETDSFGLYYQSEHNGVVYQLIPVIGIQSWSYCPCDKVESHCKDDDPVFENLRIKLAVIAHNNEILRAIKDLE